MRRGSKRSEQKKNDNTWTAVERIKREEHLRLNFVWGISYLSFVSARQYQSLYKHGWRVAIEGGEGKGRGNRAENGLSLLSISPSLARRACIFFSRASEYIFSIRGHFSEERIRKPHFSIGDFISKVILLR